MIIEWIETGFLHYHLLFSQSPVRSSHSIRQCRGSEGSTVNTNIAKTPNGTWNSNMNHAEKPASCNLRAVSAKNGTNVAQMNTSRQKPATKANERPTLALKKSSVEYNERPHPNIMSIITPMVYNTLKNAEINASHNVANQYSLRSQERRVGKHC